jgi:hypothetical protein
MTQTTQTHAIRWRTDFESAKAEAARDGKFVFFDVFNPG